MAPMVAEETQFAEVPVSVAVVSVFGLVFGVSIFAWICCQRKSTKTQKTPPYKFVHMLKGVDIYPESLSLGKKKFAAATAASTDGKTDVNGNCSVNTNTNTTTGKTTPSPTGGRPPLHLDLEKRDLNGNFTKPPHSDCSGSSAGSQTKVRSSPDLDLPSPHPGFTQPAGRALALASPGSPLSSQAPTPAVHKPREEEEEGGGERSGEGGDGRLGTLFFSLEYNAEKKAFVVHIKEAQGLTPTDGQSLTSDPYIKLTLLPEKKHRVKTRVLRKTLDPAFDETFSFYGVSAGRVAELSLHFMVLSFDRFSRDEVIGEALVPLAGVDLAAGRVLMSRQIIKRNVKRGAGRGDLLLSLCYQSTTSTLTVVVLKARHLPKDNTRTSEPYVKVNFFQGKKRVCKKKTHARKSSPNPVFNELFVFDVPSQEGLRDASVELLLLDSERRPPSPSSPSPVLGRLVLGTSAHGTPGEHWREICDHPRRQIAKWHALAED